MGKEEWVRSRNRSRSRSRSRSRNRSKSRSRSRCWLNEMSDHLAVLKPRLMIDIIIWSWQLICKEQGTRNRSRRSSSRSRSRNKSKIRRRFWLNNMSDHLRVKFMYGRTRINCLKFPINTSKSHDHDQKKKFAVKLVQDTEYNIFISGS